MQSAPELGAMAALKAETFCSVWLECKDDVSLVKTCPPRPTCAGETMFPPWRTLLKWQCESSSPSHSSFVWNVQLNFEVFKILWRSLLHMLSFKLIVDSSVKEIRAVVVAVLCFPKQQESSDNIVEVLLWTGQQAECVEMGEETDFCLLEEYCFCLNTGEKESGYWDRDT